MEQIDKNKQWSRALDGSDYLPGMVLLFVLTCTRFHMHSLAAFLNSICGEYYRVSFPLY